MPAPFLSAGRVATAACGVSIWPPTAVWAARWRSRCWRGPPQRDLTPEDIIRASSGTLKILDFGLASVDEGVGGVEAPRMTSPGALVGTPAYMASAQLNGGSLAARTNLTAAVGWRRTHEWATIEAAFGQD